MVRRVIVLLASLKGGRSPRRLVQWAPRATHLMSFLFGNKAPKAPADVVAATNASLGLLVGENEKSAAKVWCWYPHGQLRSSSLADARAFFLQAAQGISKHVRAMKSMLYADATNGQSTGPGRQLATEILRTDIITGLIRNLEKLEFEVCSAWRGVFDGSALTSSALM